MKNSINKALQSQVVIYGIFLASVVVTLYSYATSLAISKDRYHSEIALENEELTDKIEKRLHIYEQVLWSGVALFNSSETVNREEWNVFASIVDINTHWPGIQALGYSIPLMASDLKNHEQTIQTEGFPGYTVHPKNERDFYTSILYIEPFDWRNQRAFGYDMWSDATRQQAMKSAMLTGEAHASGVITLIQETDMDTQKGFIIYTPVYKTLNSPEKSLEKLKGWVYAPFRMNDFMLPITAKMRPSISINISDIPPKNSNQEHHTKNRDMLFERLNPQASTDIIFNEEIHVFGRTWQVSLRAPAYNPSKHLAPASAVLLSLGLIVDIILLLVLTQHRRSQLEADNLFQARYKDLVQSLNDKTATIELLNKDKSVLENNVDTLQEWLQERELRINELKLNQKDV